MGVTPEETAVLPIAGEQTRQNHLTIKRKTEHTNSVQLYSNVSSRANGITAASMGALLPVS
jgi:hypothetical protein